MRLPPLSPRTDWQLPSLGELPAWPKYGRVCVDVETKDPQLLDLGPGVRREGSDLVGIGFAIEDGPKAYLPIRHGNGINLDPERALEYLKDQARDFRGTIVGHNLSYDLDWLAEDGVVFRNALWFRDTMIAEPLLNELERRYSLAKCCERRGLPGKDEALLEAAAAAWGVHPKGGLWQLPPEFVGPYGEEDCLAPLRLLRRQEAALDEQDLGEVWDRESRLLPVLVKMRRRGVRIDFDQLDRVEEDATNRERSALHRISSLTGRQLDTTDTNRPASWVSVLEERGLKLPRTEPTEKFPEGQPSVKTEWLEKQDDEACRLIVEAKKWNKVRTTFVESIRRHEVKGRIHCTLKQMVGEAKDTGEASGAKFGRLSGVDPNMQNQPARDPEIGPAWRAIYLPDEGGKLLSADYSSQEPRITCHYAEEIDAPGGAEMAQRYRDDPFLDYHQAIADIMNVARKPAKTIGLGLAYNMGQGSLALRLGLPTEMKSFQKNGRTIEYLGAGPEAMELLDKYHEAVPYIRELARRTKAKADKVGYIRTWGGRRCRFPDARYGRGWDFTHKALNRIVQGSAADQMRQAMIDADDADHYLQLQVHDEVVGTVYSEAQARELGEIMRDAMQFRVPMVVDLEWGDNWGHQELVGQVS